MADTSSAEYLRESEYVFNALKATLPGFEKDGCHASMMEIYAPGEIFDLSLPNSYRHYWNDITWVHEYIIAKVASREIDSEVKDFFRVLDKLLVESGGIRLEFVLEEAIKGLLFADIYGSYGTDIGKYRELLTSPKALALWDARAEEIKAGN